MINQTPEQLYVSATYSSAAPRRLSWSERVRAFERLGQPGVSLSDLERAWNARVQTATPTGPAAPHASPQAITACIEQLRAAAHSAVSGGIHVFPVRGDAVLARQYINLAGPFHLRLQEADEVYLLGEFDDGLGQYNSSRYSEWDEQAEAMIAELSTNFVHQRLNGKRPQHPLKVHPCHSPLILCAAPTGLTFSPAANCASPTARRSA